MMTTITINIESPVLPAELEKLEDALRDLLNSKGIKATIEDTGTGNTTVAFVPSELDARFDELLEEWKSDQKSARKIELFEPARNYRDSLSLKDVEKALTNGNVGDLMIRLIELNTEYADDMYYRELEEFLKERGIDVEEYGITEFDEFRNAFEERFVWNIEDIADYNVLIIDRDMYEISFDGVTSSPDNVEQTEDYFRFEKKALSYLTEPEFNDILRNCFYSGAGYFGAIVNAGDVLKALQSDDSTVTGTAVIGIHNWAMGAGYKVHSKKDITINVKNAELDSGNYGIGGVFGTTEWIWR